MALVKCPDCGKEISSWSKTCINCGCPTPSYAADGKTYICTRCGKTYTVWMGQNICDDCILKKVKEKIEKEHEEKCSKFENRRFFFDYQNFF